MNDNPFICQDCGDNPCTCQRETDKINIENIVRLDVARDVFRGILCGEHYNISEEELIPITRLLAQLHQKVLEKSVLDVGYKLVSAELDGTHRNITEITLVEISDISKGPRCDKGTADE